MAYTDRDLSNLTISESFWRLMQTDPVDDRTLIDGTGSLVTYLAISGTLDAFYLKGDGSQITNVTASVLPSGVVSSSTQTIQNLVGTNIVSSSAQKSVLGLGTTDTPTFAGLNVNGTITAKEFNTQLVSASIIYQSGSTKFGDSLDDVHSFTGSIKVNGNITGSLFGTSSYAGFSATSSYIDPLFISASVVAQGLTGASNWDQILNKPSGLVSSSNQVIGNLVGTNIVSSSTQRSVLGLGETDSPTFANGNFTGNVVVDGTLTARTYIVSSSVLDVTTIRESGSTIFGNTFDDTHKFTGSVDITGSLLLNNQSVITSTQTSSLSVLSSSYAATSSITYVSSSNLSLSEIEVADFDSNVAVTFTNGRLKFIFGSPTLPSSLALSLSGFATNRFNLENDTYDVNGSWNNGGYTLVSASLYTGSVLVTEVYSGTSLSSNLTTSGSQNYRLQYTASSPLDGTLYSGSTTVAGTLSKTDPTSPVQTESATIQLGVSSNQIEQGATGSITITSTTSSANSWTITGFTSTGSFGSTVLPLSGNTTGGQLSGIVYVTGSATGSNSILVSTTASYNSGVLNNPVLTKSVFDSITYSKIRSLRYGASASSSFTQAELENLSTWDTTLGGSVGTIAKGTTNPSGQTVTITWTGDKYHYIIFDSSRSNLTNITTGGFGVLGQFTLTTVGSYKIYRTTTLNAGGAGTSITYVLT